jgi:hypothetical protein
MNLLYVVSQNAPLQPSSWLLHLGQYSKAVDLVGLDKK